MHVDDEKYVHVLSLFFHRQMAPDPPAEYGGHLRPVGYTAGSVIVLAAAFLRGQAATRSSWCLEHEEGKT